MAISVHYSGALVEVTMSGVVRGAELFENLQWLRDIEAREPVTPNRITDLTTATTMDIKFNEVYEFAEVRRNEKLKNPIKSAIVVSNDVQFGIARTFQMLNGNPQITVRIFREEAPARAWLAEQG